MKLSSVLAALPKLTPSELAAVKATIELLTSKPEVDDTTPLFEALSRLLGSQIPYAKFKASASHRIWRKNSPTVLAFVNDVASNSTKIEKAALVHWLIEGLVIEMRQRKIPVTIGTVCNNLTRCPEIFKAAFPGYVEDGLTHLIIKAMRKR